MPPPAPTPSANDKQSTASERSPWTTVGIWLLFAGLLALGAMQHEPWADEAQSWLMARDASLWELASSELRVFGHPVLWYIVLKIPIVLNVPYATGLAILGWLPAVAGGWLLLRRAPWPLWLRTLAVFSFFLAYQYAIVVRSYVLLPPLLFAVACLFPTRIKRPWRSVLLLVLLSHVSAHGAILSLAFMLEWLVQAGRIWKTADSPHRTHLVGATVLFTLSGILLLLMLWPTAASPVLSQKAAVTPAGFVVGMLFLTDAALAGQAAVSIIAVIASLVWFYRRQVLGLFLLLELPLLAFMSGVYTSPWHEGIPFLAWLALAWISFLPRADEDEAAPAGTCSSCRRAMLGAMALVLLFQGYATWSSYAFDLGQPYCGSQAAAEYLTEHARPGETVFLRGYHSIAIVPYLRGQTVVNSTLPDGKAYDRFGSYDDSLEAFLQMQPDWVVMEVPPNTPLSTQPGQLFDLPPPPPGYEAQLFPGILFYRTDSRGWLSFVLWRRISPAAAASGE